MYCWRSVSWGCAVCLPQVCVHTSAEFPSQYLCENTKTSRGVQIAVNLFFSTPHLKGSHRHQTQHRFLHWPREPRQATFLVNFEVRLAQHENPTTDTMTPRPTVFITRSTYKIYIAPKRRNQEHIVMRSKHPSTHPTVDPSLRPANSVLSCSR